MTKNRWMVLESLLEADQPMRAYELLRQLEMRLGRRLSPPTVYRALDFLVEQGLVSRIATKSAFVPSTHADSDLPRVFFICDSCGLSAELENAKLEALLERDAASLGFHIGRRVIELQGTCASCLELETKPAAS
ncbi:Fur family transcriptional regulator [Afifella pfennigii]|uniref:Fur family transcriptional regulator n=1 Tax=Afifella pfennigii TaxID=209897 RepID=UPI0024807E16|nr:Fur family transcriptional regulator [Afifella pfennigii]